MPYKDPEKRRQARIKKRIEKALLEGRDPSGKAGAQRKIPRCSNCPESGDPCRECYNAHRRTYRNKAAGRVYANKKKPTPRQPVTPREKKTKPVVHRIAVVVKPVDKFLIDELVSCPGCMRKMRGAWRYCERCEAKRA